jgi:hypothetical protein
MSGLTVPLGRSRTRPVMRSTNSLRRVGGCESSLDVRVVDDLHDAGAIAHVEKDHAAVIAASMHPTTEFDFAIDLRCVEIATVVTAHEKRPRGNVARGGSLSHVKGLPPALDQ